MMREARLAISCVRDEKRFEVESTFLIYISEYLYNSPKMTTFGVKTLKKQNENTLTNQLFYLILS